MNLQSRLVLAAATAVLASAAPLPAAAEGLDLAQVWLPGVAHTYVWLEEGEKVAETSFRFEKADAGVEPRLRLKSQFRLARSGITQNSEAELLLKLDGSPLSFRSETQLKMASQRPFQGRHEVRIQFAPNKTVSAAFVHNGNEKDAARHEIEVPPDTVLLATYALEQWAVFAPRLLPARKVTLPVYYPEFGKVLQFRFQPRPGTEKLRIGDKDLEATSLDFEAVGAKFTGRIWLDEKGRLLQYSSGPLKLVLSPGGR
jgi:hypothetical protein